MSQIPFFCDFSSDPMLKEMGKKVQDIKSQIDDAILNMSDMMESATQSKSMHLLLGFFFCRYYCHSH